MNVHKIIKISYHLFVFFFLEYLLFFYHFPMYIHYILFILSLVHLYDVWWFYNYTGNAPI